MVLIGIVIIMVIAGGAYFFGKSQAPKSQNSVIISQTSQPTITSQPAPIPDETANWETYTNTKYGFSLKYPPDWYAWNSGNQVAVSEDDSIYVSFQPKPPPGVIYGGNPGGLVIRVRDDRNPIMNAKEYVDNVIIPAQEPVLRAKIKIKSANLDKIDAIIVDGVGHATDSFSPIMAAYIVRSTSDKQAIELMWDQIFNEEDKKLFSQILSTFKFIQ